MPTLDPRIAAVTDRIIGRSKHGRTRYLAQMADQAENADLASRDDAPAPPPDRGTGRELFVILRVGGDDAERGASAMLAAMETVT